MWFITYTVTIDTKVAYSNIRNMFGNEIIHVDPLVWLYEKNNNRYGMSYILVNFYKIDSDVYKEEFIEDLSKRLHRI